MKISKEELNNYVQQKNFKDGYKLLYSQDTDTWYFVDRDGNLSEGFYSAKDYEHGFAIVKKAKNNGHQFRDMSGNLSSKFYFAMDYDKRGLAIVKVREDSPYQLRNTAGQLSHQTFRSVVDAKNAKIVTFENKFANEKLKSADSIYELTGEEILTHLDEIRTFLNYEYQKAVKKCTTKQERVEILDRFTAMTDYVKHMAYEEHLSQKDLNDFKNIQLF